MHQCGVSGQQSSSGEDVSYMKYSPDRLFFMFARSVFDQKWPIYVLGVKILLNRCIRICVMEIELSTRKGEPYLASFVCIRF